MTNSKTKMKKKQNKCQWALQMDEHSVEAVKRKTRKKKMRAWGEWPPIVQKRMQASDAVVDS